MKIFLLMISSMFMLSGCIKTEVKSQKPNDDKENRYITVNADDFKELLIKYKNNPDAVVIDVRTPDEFSGGHIDGAVNIDYYAADFKASLDALDKSKIYLIYCRSGNRSGRTLSIMQDMNFSKVYNLNGGYNDIK